ncbi:MAG TPA: DUF2807 domain-containing protein, partial [Candidatus Binatia bacterium]|nr:DUF2807 domain-containing protein [Candidatus Binatia bacterium]
IEEIIKTIGSVADLAGDTKKMESEAPAPGRKKLYRNPDDQIIAGVSSGIASYFGIDPIIPRIGFVLFTLAGGYGILLYIIMWIIVPEATTSAEKLEMKGNAVNLANIEESRKERKDNKNFSMVRYFLRELFYLLGRFFRSLVKVLASIIGVVLTAASFVGIFALSLFTLFLLFNPDSSYIDPTIAQVFNGSQYVVLISSAFVALVIPALTVLLLGIGAVRRRNMFTVPVGLTFVILWLAGALTFGVMASSSAPQIEAAVKSIEDRPKQSKEFQVGHFSSIRTERDQKVKVIYGNTPRIIAYGDEDELNGLQMTVRNNTLNIDQQDDNFEICLFCIHRPITIEITVPEINTVSASNSSLVEVLGFSNIETIRLDANNAGRIKFDGTAKTTNVVLGHAARVELIGSGDNLVADLSNASRLDASNFPVEVAELEANNSSRIDVNVSQRLKAEASHASRINYTGSPDELELDESNAASINGI